MIRIGQCSIQIPIAWLEGSKYEQARCRPSLINEQAAALLGKALNRVVKLLQGVAGTPSTCIYCMINVPALR